MSLSASHPALALLATTAPDCLICTDRAGVVLEFNAAAEATLGWRREEVLGKRVSELILPPAARQRHPMSAYRPGELAQLVGQRHEVPVFRRDGSQFLAESVFFTAEFDGIPVLVTHLRDVTAAREMSRVTATRLAEAEARGRSQVGFVSAMSHGMRTPLATLSGSLQLLSEITVPREERRLVRAAHDAVLALTQLLDDVGDFVALESGQVTLDPVGFAPEDLLESAVHSLGPHARRQQVTLLADLDPALPGRLVMDRDRLWRVVVGMAVLAIRFAPSGEVRLHLRSTRPGWLRVEVWDDGAGFVRERQAVLAMAGGSSTAFELPEVGGAEGLMRVTLCRHLVRAMGGQFGVEADTRGGFVSWAELPWQPEEVPLVSLSGAMDVPVAEPGATGMTRARRSLHVLLVEDSQSNRLVLAELLRRRGCEVDLAVNGLDAIDTVRRHLPDLVLMDIDMPELDGVSALRALRELGGTMARLPVVAMTAHATPGARREFLSIGFDDYLPKPVDAPRLLATLARWMPRTAALPAAREMHFEVSAESAATPAPELAPDPPGLAACSDSTWLEPGALRRLAREVGQARFPRMLRIFCEELERRAGLLKAALAERDLAGIARESHVLKGSAITFGAHGLQDAAQLANDACRSNDSAAAFAGVERLLDLVPPTLAALRSAAMAG